MGRDPNLTKGETKVKKSNFKIAKVQEALMLKKPNVTVATTRLVKTRVTRWKKLNIPNKGGGHGKSTRRGKA